MKRAILLALTMTLLCAGCGSGRQTPQDFTRWQRQMAEASEIRFSAGITGEWDEGTMSFSADVVRTEEGTAVTVTDPETIAGITFRSSPGGDTLEFDSVILELAPQAPAALSPCAAGPILGEALTGGNLIWSGREGQWRTVSLAAPGGETVTVWYTEEFVPVRAEIARGEATELVMTLENWEVKE